MKIAICDDCVEDIWHLKTLIQENPHCPSEAEFFEYKSGIELLNDYQDFDIVFLDMQMECMSGKETAENIRKRDSEVIISFYSGYEAAAHEILNSRPLRYLLKNSGAESLALEIDLVLKEVTSDWRRKQIKVQYYGVSTILKLSDILYISINNKGSLIWITNKKAQDIFGKKGEEKEAVLKSGVNLKTYYAELKDYGFIYASKSYIVNAENITSQTANEVVLKDGTRLSLSRGVKKSFGEEYGKFWKRQHDFARVKK